jgi:hypothetical protein
VATNAELSARQRGDFQTPEGLARQVWSSINVSDFDLVIEPTFGLGSFLATVPGECEAEIVGWEIKEHYYRVVRARMADRAQRLLCGDVFNVSAQDIPAGSRVLVIGNPPWVTNSEQSALGGQNTGNKKNLKSLNGLEAMTGKANFDISEAIILHFISLLRGRAVVQFAMLGKFTVLRNLIQFIGGEPNVGGFEFHRIDAGKHFSAAVDAGLIKFTVGGRRSGQLRCPIYDGVGGRQVGEIGMVGKHLIYDLERYEKTRFMEHKGLRQYTWRQGIKHDLSDVLELRECEGGFVNRRGEQVDVEPEIIYRLYKSSDLFHGRNARYVVPVYQRDLQDTLEDLPVRCPRLYRYLSSHRGAFDARKSRIYKNKNSFTMFGIGAYTHQRYKVAIGALYTSPVFRLLEPDGHPVVVDDTGYMIATDNRKEAAYIATVLNLNCTKDFLLSVSNPTDKRRYSKDVLDRVLIPPAETCPQYDQLSWPCPLKTQGEISDWLLSYRPEGEQASLF